MLWEGGFGSLCRHCTWMYTGLNVSLSPRYLPHIFWCLGLTQGNLLPGDTRKSSVTKKMTRIKELTLECASSAVYLNCKIFQINHCNITIYRHVFVFFLFQSHVFLIKCLHSLMKSVWHLEAVGQLIFSRNVAEFYRYYSKILKYLTLLQSLVVFPEQSFRIP